MARRSFLLFLLATAVLLAPGFGEAQTAVEKPRYAGTWKLVVDGQATAAGTLKFAIRPRSQPETEFSVAIPKDRAADGIARDIRTALRGKLDRHAYTITLEGRSTLVFVAEMGTPRFDLALLDSSIAGVQVTITPQ